MNTATYGAAAPASAATENTSTHALYRKISWRLIPLLFVCYIFNYLDRTNIGYAQLQMKADLGFGDAVFGLGAGVFFIGYALFEIPSNVMLARVGMRATLLRIMALWGLASAATLFVTTPTQFYVLRFLVGVFEAGFAPGVLFYLTLWFPAQQRARATALFFMAYGAAPIVAGPLAGLTMTYLDGALSLRGWQWLFVVEGLPCVLLGVLAYRWLDNRPEEAGWLTSQEKAQVRRDLAQEQAIGGGAPQSFGSALRNPQVWLLGFISFLVILGIYAMSFWQPTLLQSMGLSVLQIGFYSVVPATLGIAATLVVARHSDRTQERRWHFAVGAVLGAVGLSLTTLFMHSPWAAVACLSLSAMGVSSAFAVLWAVPASLLAKDAAAMGIALITTLGGTAGVVAPVMVGAIKSATGGFSLSLYILSGALVLAAALMVAAGPRRRVA
ncbi:MFS transporter [Acidovorax sp. ACV01]|uniref:MFS transporter n=1 Tax=Acidovorax sp. ACV01 TaxID=2769311 RepID=UPI00177DE65E|nr:MFS transporter [Acidovorax sp. ACV01]MBD9391065.1 MFS transporter [Acidovorax sp. ACV01]